MRKASWMLSLALIAVLSSLAVGEEVTVGKMKLTYNTRGIRGIFYGDTQVVTRVYCYYADKAKTITHWYPGRDKVSVALDPKIEKIKDKAGKETGVVLTWRYKEGGWTKGLAVDKPSFIRATVTANEVKIDFHVVPSKKIKGYGEIGLNMPKDMLIGATWSCKQGSKTAEGTITEKEGPRSVFSRTPFTIVSPKGFTMKMTDPVGLALQDRRRYKKSLRFARGETTSRPFGETITLTFEATK